MIDRRTFLEGAALSVLSAPRPAAAAAPAPPVPRVGVLGAANPVAWTVRTSAAEVECRWAGDRPARLPALAAELIDRGVDVLVAVGAPAARAAMRATRTVPIVFVAGGDPARGGLAVDAGGLPGNVTGLQVPSGAETAEASLRALLRAAPRLERLTALWSPGDDAAEGVRQHLAAIAPVALRAVAVRSLEDIERAFAGLAGARADGVLVLRGALFAVHAGPLVRLAAAAGVPAAYGARSFVDAGGLLAVHGDQAAVLRRATGLVARVLAGTAPGALPVESLAATALVVNVAAARALGLALPASLVASASAVVGA